MIDVKQKRLFLGNDHGAIVIRPAVIQAAKLLGFEILDFGTDSVESVDYPCYAKKVCDALKDNAGIGILMCGTGIGVSIAANRYRHIRAALCHEEQEAQLARQHNNANVLCLGGRILTPEMAAKLTNLFLTSTFEGGRHQKRIDLIDTIDNLDDLTC